MIVSMTGFGRASGHVSDRFSVTVAAKSVNHRYLEPSIRIPEFLWEIEAPIRTLASEVFHRGKLDVSLRVQRLSEPEHQVRINKRIANAVIPQITGIVSDFGLTANFTASDLLRIPDLVEVETVEQELSEDDRSAILGIVRQAFEQILEMRRTEGKALADDIRMRLHVIRTSAEKLQEQRPVLMEELLQNYRDRVAEIGKASGIEVDPERLAQETVILAEKGDVAEELTRLASHLKQMEGLLSGENVGKKLDFLTQEVLREINTLGSKSRSSVIRSVVVELKAEVERIREQVQNVE